MKRLIHALMMCQSMFCAIPCPWKTWDEEARPRMLLFLPLIGLEMGLLWALLGWLCRYLNLPNLVTGLVMCAFPYVVSGFIHLDGFMDVCDAVGSCRSLEKRRAILKDSHVGAFAVIGLALLLISGFALMSSAEGDCRILVLVPVLSRTLSALAVTTLRPISESQYAGTFRAGVSKGQPVFLTLVLLVTLALGFLLWKKQGFVLVGGLLGYALALRKGFKSLEGMNGDISGYALTWSELCAVAVYALI